MEVLAIIPARKGSKGIPNKNVTPLCGQPLLAYSIEAALKSTFVTRVIVSTDSTEYAEISKDFGADVPFLRPAELAADDVHAVHVIGHVLEELQLREQYIPDLVVMLLPTSPLRKPRTIDKAITILLEANAPSVVSVAISDKQTIHFRRIVDKKLEPLVRSDEYNVQRQDLPPLYVLNGSIYVSRPETILNEGSFHVEGTFPIIMSRAESVDINDFDDLNLARFYLTQAKS